MTQRKQLRLKRAIFFSLLLVLLGRQGGWAQTKSPVLTLNHAAICVHDLKVSTEFYKSVLALEEIPNPFNDGIHTWFKIGPSLQLHVIQRGCAVVPEKNVHLCFSTASLPELANHLKKQHVAYSNLKGDAQEFTTRADGIKQLYLQDPDGYWIEINDAK